MKISIILEALTGTFETDMKRASKAAERAAKETQEQWAKVGIAIGAAVASAATALAVLTRNSINSAANLADMAQKVGVSVEALSTLGYAAAQSGVSIEQLQGGLVKLAKNASDAAQGTGSAVNAFAALGISVKDSSGALKDTDVLLREVSEQLSQYRDGANKTAIAVQIFGRAGAELIPLLNEGAAGLSEMEQRARDLGIEMDTQTAVAAEAFGDKLDDIAMLAKGFGNDLARELLPTLNALAEEFINNSVEMRKGSVAASGIATVFKGLIAVAYTVKAAIEAVTNIVAAQVDVMIAGGQAALDFFENYGSASNVAYKLANGTLKPLAEINNEFSQSLIRAKEAASSGIDDAIDGLSTAYSALGAAAGPLNEEIKETGENSKAAAPAVVDLAKAEAARNKVLDEQVRQLRTLKAVMRDMERDRDRELMLQGEAAVSAMKLVDALREEVEFIGMSDDEIRRLIETRQLENEIKAAGSELTAAAANQLRDEMKATQDLRTAKEEYADAMERIASMLEGAFDDFTSGVQESIADALIEGGKEGLETLTEALDKFRRDMLQQRFILPIGAAFQSGGVGGVMTGMQNNFGNGTGFTNAGGGMNWGNVGQFASGAYGVYDQSQNGQGGGGGALAGAAAGAQAGMVFGPWGAAIGAIIGGIVGYMGGGDPTIRVADRESDATARSRLDDMIGVARDNMEPGTATAFANAIREFDNQLASIFDSYSDGVEDMERVREALANWSIRVEGDAANIENVLGERFDSVLATFSADVQEFVNEADTLQDRVSRFAQVLIRADQITSIMDALAEMDLLAGMTETERALYQLNQQYDAVVEQLGLLEAAEEQIAQVEEFRARAIERLTGAQIANTEAAEENLSSYAEFIDQFGSEFASGSAFQRALRDVRVELQQNIDTANELARAAGLQSAREQDLLGVRSRAERQIAELIQGLTETVVQQIAELYGTTAQQLEEQLADIDRQIAAIDRSDSGFGMVQALIRDAQLQVERADIEAQLEQQRAAEEALRRQTGALELAQNLADLSLARGISFDDLASELGLNLDRFGADLGLTADGVRDLITSLEADSLTADLFSDGVQRIVDAITGNDQGPISQANLPGDGYYGEKPGIPLPAPKYLDAEAEASGGLRDEIRALREEVVALRQQSGVQLDRVATNTAGSNTELRRIGRAGLYDELNRTRDLGRNSPLAKPKVRA